MHWRHICANARNTFINTKKNSEPTPLQQKHFHQRRQTTLTWPHVACICARLVWLYICSETPPHMWTIYILVSFNILYMYSTSTHLLYMRGDWWDMVAQKTREALQKELHINIWKTARDAIYTRICYDARSSHSIYYNYYHSYVCGTFGIVDDGEMEHPHIYIRISDHHGLVRTHMNWFFGVARYDYMFGCASLNSWVEISREEYNFNPIWLMVFFVRCAGFHMYYIWRFRVIRLFIIF